MGAVTSRAPASKRVAAKGRQAGRFMMGLIVGLLIGLALALGVALYVTKVPVPFINKVPQRSAEQDAAEAQKNKNWDPNSPLAGKTPMRPVPPSPAASVAVPPAASEPVPAAIPSTPAEPPVARASAPASTRDPAAILGERSAAASAPTASGKSPPTIVSTVPGYDPFTYFVQAGAYGRNEDAEQQRAKLAMLGFEGKLSEREQNGRTVYRVRVGPFERKEDADSTKERLAGSGIEAALVRVQK